MAMMMTGRVLLVCALCVLWCVAGGRCDEERAGDTPDGLSGASLNGETQPTEPKALSQVPVSLNLPSKPQRNEESERLPPKESLKANEENSFERPVVSEVEPIQEETAEQLSESEEDLLETQKEEKKTQVLQDEVQNGNQSTPHAQSTNQALQPSVESHAASPGGPSGGVKDSLVSPSSGVIPLPHGDGDRGITGSIPSNLQSTFPKAVLPTEADAEHHSLPNTQAVAGDNTNSTATPGSGGSSLLEAQKAKDLESETHQTAASSEDLNTELKSGGKVQLELGSATPEPQTSHGIIIKKTNGSEGHNTDISKSLLAAQEPDHVQEKNNENPASTPNGTQGISAGTREEAPASHPNESTSPIKQETFTGIKTTEDAQSPDAAATEKRQTGDKTKNGDSDSSTAVSHTTSPLLLLLLVACAAAAAAAAA
ncbi:mucin-associated surface protein (MASP) [Trypanosoma cruzi Dm28c]|uniref:Mucin-associated surface protein (MASP) n=2 Tax=Trypanosoma cruzi TaxID=5693 RepID=V5BAD5_TRYCR|nr:mucin-associated surface protein (MASP) [Trypanosoma cruzi Dm28c]PBJ68540.1 mucin-associated surface protein [Trypanosoma cruzi cruzi]PWU86439.1 Mucin-associated surface protein (MASP) [Trypanosoma cruzi]